MPRLDKINKELTAHLEIDEKGVQELELELANLGEQITVERLDQEIELNSRLDARIDRLLKRLFQVKAAKQMIGLGSGSPEAAAAPREIASSPCDQAAKPPVTHPRSQPQ